MKSTNISEPGLRRDGFAITSCLLALFIMILPVEADMLFVLMGRSIGAGAVFAVGCFAVVATPFALSLRRRSLQPGVWANRGSLITAGVILALNILSVSSIFMNKLAH
jgi:hypothetical protein